MEGTEELLECTNTLTGLMLIAYYISHYELNLMLPELSETLLSVLYVCDSTYEYDASVTE